MMEKLDQEQAALFEVNDLFRELDKMIKRRRKGEERWLLDRGKGIYEKDLDMEADHSKFIIDKSVLKFVCKICKDDKSVMYHELGKLTF
jgi:hypothetical protein